MVYVKLINHLSLSLFLHPAPPPPELLPPIMDSLDSNRVDIFEIYRRYCDIRSGSIYKENNNQLEDETQSGKRSRDELAHLLKFVELNVHTRTSIFDELAKFKSKLEFMVDFSEFSRFYDFVYFMCREKCQKNITVGKAAAAWRLVLAGRFRLLNQWCDFVQENQRHNISEDTWQQVLAFSRCVHENLEGYDPEGAWPVLIDDFVEHMYRVSGPNKDLNVFCNCGDSESQSCAFEDALPGLKITPGLKRKMPNFGDEMDVTDSPSPGFAGLHIAPNSKRNRLISHRRMSLGNSAGDCMEIIKHSSQLGSSKSPCAVEGCLSKGFAGLFSTRSYLQLDHERRLSFT